MQLIKKTALDVTTLENQKVSKIIFESYNIENINIFLLLFQTAYLTVTRIETEEFFSESEYTLNYPNFEVKPAFITYLFESFTNISKSRIKIMESVF